MGGVELTVRVFAGLRARFGGERVTVELPDRATAADLLAALGLPERSCIVAVERTYVEGDHRLDPATEIALIPPVSGGAIGIHVRLTSEPLDAAAVTDRVRDPRAGAVITFLGVTRDVPLLEYEAYAEMAEPVLRRIAEEEAARHGLCAAALEHRTGSVGLSEPSVVVAVSAPHRVEAFAAAQAIMDRLKAEAPIWKQEEGEWVSGALPEPS